LIADATSQKSRAGQLSLYQTLAGIPGMASPAIGGYLVSAIGIQDGFRAGILVAAAASVLSTVLLIRFLREEPTRSGPISDAERPGSPEGRMAKANVSVGSRILGALKNGSGSISILGKRSLSNFQTFVGNTSSLP